MAKIFVISDTHFNHSNILKFTHAVTGALVRPEFKDMAEMNETIVRNWNSVVTPQDHVYHLGDVYFGHGKDSYGIRNILSRLNGHKRLILGNHDDAKDKNLTDFFEKIMVWRMFPDLGVLLTHVPVHDSTLKDHPKIEVNFHGHIHRAPNVSPRHVNVSVEMMNYTPKLIEEIKNDWKRSA